MFVIETRLYSHESLGRIELQELTAPFLSSESLQGNVALSGAPVVEPETPTRTEPVPVPERRQDDIPGLEPNEDDEPCPGQCPINYLTEL